MTIVKVDRHSAYKQVHDYLKLQKNDVYFNIEIKRWRALKTKKERGLLFKAIEHFIREMNGGIVHYVSEEEKLYVERGIVGKWGLRKKTGLIIIDGYGNEEEQKVPIPLRECNRFEQFNAVFEGVFQEANERGIDMTEFYDRWEDIKKQREAKP